MLSIAVAPALSDNAAAEQAAEAATAFLDPDTGDLMETYLSRGSTGGYANSYTGLSRMISLSARADVDIDTIIDSTSKWDEFGGVN